MFELDDLQDAMLNQLKFCDSKFNLIHNVWTTKGNALDLLVHLFLLSKMIGSSKCSNLV
ncbi:hypothetical protein VP01_12490g2 [Puccinia sorghi]|uniref:Uncharacterized protein n=1 Tax=Puccinia sorghi TaxID=27349 RepID=A0A0L6VPI0_9BASI|nr:hypothetical protein VP01_12490g2 [Puccinia sorghi]